MVFTVLDDFFSDKLQTQYVAGMSYEAQDDNTELLKLIPKWIEEGKIREGGPQAKVSGTGEVTEPEE